MNIYINLLESNIKMEAVDQKTRKQAEFYDEIKEIIKHVPKSLEDFTTINFEDNLIKILNSYNCSFGYQNKNSKKHGHLKEKVNLETNERKLELKIERNDNTAGKIYTICHELAHLYNDHLHSKALTKKQKEVVADTVGILCINFLSMERDFLNSNLAKKWNVLDYSKNYIFSMSFSREKERLIKEQIYETFNFLVANLFE